MKRILRRRAVLAPAYTYIHTHTHTRDKTICIAAGGWHKDHCCCMRSPTCVDNQRRRTHVEHPTKSPFYVFLFCFVRRGGVKTAACRLVWPSPALRRRRQQRYNDRCGTTTTTAAVYNTRSTSFGVDGTRLRGNKFKEIPDNEFGHHLTVIVFHRIYREIYAWKSIKKQIYKRDLLECQVKFRDVEGQKPPNAK